MLLACLVLGFSISSFVYRRQPYDPFQVLVFLLLLAVAVTAGLGAGASGPLILLGYAPWAMCAAMVISYAVHGLWRRRLSRAIPCQRELEKNGLLQ